MTYALGRRSRRNLVRVHPDLVRVVELAIQRTTQDFGVPDGGGARDLATQAIYVERGTSRTLQSDHVVDGPDDVATAIDLVPFVDGRLDWSDDALHRYDAIAAAVRSAARDLGVAVGWGAEWSSFRDYPHWYLISPAQEGPAPSTTQEADVADPDPLITAEERDTILDHFLTEAGETVDQVKAGRHLDGSDAVEIGLSLAQVLVTAIAPPAVRPVLTFGWPMVTDALVGLAETAEASARTADRIAERVTEARQDIEDHESAIAALEATPQREFFEKLRINLRRGRIRALSRKIARLEGYLE